MKKCGIYIFEAMGSVLVAALVLTLVRVERGFVRSAPEGWANIARYSTATLLVIGTYRARYRKGREGDWWFGFALGGWAYCLFSGDMIWQWAVPTHMPNSLISALPHWIIHLIPRHWMERVVLTYSILPVSEVRAYLARVVQALLVLLVAIVGGLVNLMLSWRRRSRSSDG